MKYAYDFRKIAWESLRNNWGVAILTGFVAFLIGANILEGGAGGISGGSSSDSSASENPILSPEVIKTIMPFLIGLLAVIFLWATVVFIIGGAGKLGYAKFNLNLIDGQKASFSDLFSQFNRLGEGILMVLLVRIYTILWTMLFIVPGIIKSFSYAMTPYILAEHPELSANEAITESRKMMHGNKWRLFCLKMSFIGWALLGVVPMIALLPLLIFGVGGAVAWIILSLLLMFAYSLFLRPYQEAAQAAFYRDISFANVPQFDCGYTNPENANYWEQN